VKFKLLSLICISETAYLARPTLLAGVWHSKCLLVSVCFPLELKLPLSYSLRSNVVKARVAAAVAGYLHPNDFLKGSLGSIPLEIWKVKTCISKWGMKVTSKWWVIEGNCAFESVKDVEGRDEESRVTYLNWIVVKDKTFAWSSVDHIYSILKINSNLFICQLCPKYKTLFLNLYIITL